MQAMFRGYRLRRDLEYDYAAVRVQVRTFAGFVSPCLPGADLGCVRSPCTEGTRRGASLTT